MEQAACRGVTATWRYGANNSAWAAMTARRIVLAA